MTARMVIDSDHVLMGVDVAGEAMREGAAQATFAAASRGILPYK
jgi:hypothetical protein